MHYIHKYLCCATTILFVSAQFSAMNAKSIPIPNLKRGHSFGLSRFIRRPSLPNISGFPSLDQINELLRSLRMCYQTEEFCPTWSSWQGLDSCSASCGRGFAMERRYCGNKQAGATICLGDSTRRRECNLQRCPHWTSWYPSSPCSSDCISGQRLLKRNCSNGVSEVDGCEGPTHQIAICYPNKSCSPKWSQWTDFGDCSASCGTHGRQARRRQCTDSNGNIMPFGCEGPDNHTQSCNTDVICPPKYSPWSQWDSCNATCENWTTINRNRRCLIPPCKEEKLVESRVCGWDACVEAENETDVQETHQTQWGWSSWTPCSASCGQEGYKLRARNCSIYGQTILCERHVTEYVTCLPSISCPAWARWSKWTDCGGTCQNKTGTRLRHRQCVVTRLATAHVSESGSEALHNLQPNSTADSIKESVDVELCDGGYESSYQHNVCPMVHCDPYWKSWSQWSSCSSSCGRGYQTKTRECNVFDNSTFCTGESVKYQRCISNPCWSPWSVFTPCTKSCGSGGFKNRSRRCLEVASTSRLCEGPAIETVRCNTHVCPRWGEWKVKSRCSVTCGEGVVTKERQCLEGDCKGPLTAKRPCSPGLCPTWTDWSTYSCCSETCGSGVKRRTRTCLHEKLGYPGCIGSGVDVQQCDAGSCNITGAPSLGLFECGRRRSRNFVKSVLRIWGGRPSASGNWPWQVSLQEYACRRNGQCWHHFCGGMLIAPQWVLSAAHCLSIKKIDGDNISGRISVAMGSNNLRDESQLIRMAVRRVIKYEGFIDQTLANDIALIKLERPVSSRSVVPACLPGGRVPQANQKCYITGWGYAGTGHSFVSNVLLEAQIPIIDGETCRQISEEYGEVDPNTQLCAGNLTTAATDTCRGDSGGPISCQDKQGHWYVAGITSHGIKSCGTPGHAGVYASISSYERWIRNTIESHAHGGC